MLRNFCTSHGVVRVLFLHGSISSAAHARRNIRRDDREKLNSAPWASRGEEGVAKAEYIVVACAACVCVVALPVFSDELSRACSDAICAMQRMGNSSKSCTYSARMGDAERPSNPSIDLSALPTTGHATRLSSRQLRAASTTSPNVGLTSPRAGARRRSSVGIVSSNADAFASTAEALASDQWTSLHDLLDTLASIAGDTNRGATDLMDYASRPPVERTPESAAAFLHGELVADSNPTAGLPRREGGSSTRYSGFPQMRCSTAWSTPWAR